MTSTVLKIDPRIREWIAPLLPDEQALLEASLQAEGCRDALITWDGTLIDGHHRYAICERLDLPFRVIAMDFPDRDHVEVWVRQNQMARRNLTDDQRAHNADLLAEAEERITRREQARAVGKQGGRGHKKTQDATGESRVLVPKPRTAKRVAKSHGVSEKRLRRARAIRKHSPALAKKIQAGDVTIKEAEREIRTANRAATRAQAVTAAQTATAADTDATVIQASMTDVGAGLDDGSVSLVFTDPPYHDETLPIYKDLGTVAARVLKPGGSLITYTSHHRLPEVIAMLQAAGLTFFWPIAMVHKNPPYARMTEYGIVVRWKPLLWFVKGKFRSRDDLRFVDDLVESGREKESHPWQQSVIEARYYIEGLTQPGDLVFDPFCGGGTTAVAAAQTLRRWLTCDVDEQAVWIARQRLRDVRQAVPA